ncbi:MAG: glycosyltransferase family 2 protein [Thermoproteota archaeon]
MKRIYKILPNCEVIVVDSSNDGTDQIASFEGAKVIKQEKRGYGAALKSGIENASGEFVIFMDGDGTYDPSDIPKLLEPLVDGLADLVLGCRFRSKPKNMSMIRYIGNVILSVLFSLLFFEKVKDTQTGMKGARREAFLKMNLNENGMQFSTEVLSKALKHGFKVLELNIKYHERTGESKLRPLNDGLGIIFFIMKERLSRASLAKFSRPQVF